MYQYYLVKINILSIILALYLQIVTTSKYQKMNLKRLLYVFAIGLTPILGYAQENKSVPENWFNLDYEKDGVLGISTERTYESLLKGKKSTPVIVAVLDGGVDVNHEDLKNIVWINLKDSISNGVDNDKNGFINDKYGWNFIGNATGENVHFDNLELTRLIRKHAPKYDGVTASTVMTDQEKRAYNAYLKMVDAYNEKLDEAKYGALNYVALKENIDNLIKSINKDKSAITTADLDSLNPPGNRQKIAIRIAKEEIEKAGGFEKFYNDLTEGANYFGNQVAYHLNKEYDSRSIVGDNYDDAREYHYGNSDVTGPDALHGTHVAGIIAADRKNNIGIKGVANDVKILSVRLVPDGDERDKDVANGIRYAVDNGAKVINMSFGKGYAYNKNTVDEAVKYAMSKDVLLVHAAGNDSEDNDISPNYPNKFYTDSLGAITGVADAWITVGATGPRKDDELLASFSNYGKASVDVFAPGLYINSTAPHSEYKEEQGTSMAAPVVAGLAGMLRSYYPQLSALETKEIIMNSVTKLDDSVRIKLEDGSYKTVKLADISISGGIVNAYMAVQKANEYLIKKKK
ncbi:subtilase family protein [Sphingobacterium sp. JUb20]|nr:subtilase family protein [Sphingobacterium sp. JUb20]